MSALRRSREALLGLDSELDDLLARLRTPGAALDSSAPDRLASAKDAAIQAMAELRDYGQLFA